jgi:SAM-dependent methyltransferase
MQKSEQWFVRMPGFGARMYDWLAGRPRTMQLAVQEIARDLTSQILGGRLLDVGTGHGRLLAEIHRVNPEIELYGLDISEAMVRVASRNLAGLDVDLRCGNIRSNEYASDFFDLVTCTGSFYLWEEPVEGLQEIHRILIGGCRACLFEPHAGVSDDDLRRGLRTALSRESPLRRVIGPFFIKKAVRLGLHTTGLTSLLDRSPFRGNYEIEQIALGGLPAWLRITLTKSAPVAT